MGPPGVLRTLTLTVEKYIRLVWASLVIRTAEGFIGSSRCLGLPSRMRGILYPILDEINQ